MSFLNYAMLICVLATPLTSNRGNKGLPEPAQCAMWWKLLIWSLYQWLGFLTKLIERQFPEWVGSLKG
ncbi:hypothetical protein CRM22_011418 [Opisthorchis felineus]|uniref:Uncharacterized protein n=1 Tax=Opisthorchis felineus TaxID=147828 RepID=A0A4S2JD84_OPIFE|nr:hypothetical protein CRM22_011418 [Opisthorchis felineus]